MAPHSSTLAWKIPWTEEPGGLQSMGSLRIGHDWVTSLSLFTFMYRRRKWQPTPVILPGESWDGGAWWAAISAVTQSRTRLKRLSRSSSIGIWCCIIAHLMLYYSTFDVVLQGKARWIMKGHLHILCCRCLWITIIFWYKFLKLVWPDAFIKKKEIFLYPFRFSLQSNN